MDLTRLAADAGQFINRAVQYTGESLGQTDRTEWDPELEQLLNRAEATKTRTEQIISQTEVLLQPNPGARLEDRLYEHLEWSTPPRPRAHEVLGDQMIQAGLEMGTNTPYGATLLRCGEAQRHFGETEKKFVQSANIHFLNPLRSFTEREYRVIQDERRILLNKRLDLDIAKNRLKKAHEAEQESRTLNASPLEVDYLSHVSYMFSFLRVKWLKMWAQEISQAEMELRICQSLFDRQSENTKQLLEGISSTHTNHLQNLTDFVEAQASYFAQCSKHTHELQKELASLPAVLCSNSWQSAITHAANEPSTSNRGTNEPVALNEVTPVPVVVHHLPDFDQDTWTAQPPPMTGKKTTDNSVITQPLNQTNYNNNNNNNNNIATTLPADNQATSRPSAVDPAVSDTCTSNSDAHTTNHTSAVSSNTDIQISGATSDPPPTSQTAPVSVTPLVTDCAGSGLTTTAPSPSQLSGTADESQAENASETPSEQSSVNGENGQESQGNQDGASSGSRNGP